MSVLLFCIVWIVSAAIGGLGWSQIVGSIQQFYIGRLFTITFWGVILFIGWYLCNRFLPGQIIALYIGYDITLFLTLGEGRIE